MGGNGRRSNGSVVGGDDDNDNDDWVNKTEVKCSLHSAIPNKDDELTASELLAKGLLPLLLQRRGFSAGILLLLILLIIALLVVVVDIIAW